MEFLNLHSSALDSPEMAGAEPAELGTWLMLARYCAGQENGGVITGCRAWTDRKWQTVVRVAQAMVIRDCELWRWDGDDLHVMHYPAEQEAVVKAKRERNRHAGQAKSEMKSEAARANGQRGGRPRTRGMDLTESHGDGGIASHELATGETGSGGNPGGGNGIPTGNPTENPTYNPTARDDIRTEGKGREGKKMETGERESAPVRAHRDDGIDDFHEALEADLSRQAEQVVAAYPRRERFAESLALVRSQLKSGESFAAMLAGTRGAAAFLAQVPAGAANKYAPSALKFFEGKRWMDDPATLVRPPAASASAGNGGGRHDRGELSAEELALQLGGRVY